MLRLSDFDYNLTQNLIAQYPLEKRDEARLLILDRAKQTIEHKVFKDIGVYFKNEDLLILNDTRVLCARLAGRRKTGGKAELLLLKHKGALVFDCLIKPSRIKMGEKIIFNGDKIFAEVSARNEVAFSCEDINRVYSLGLIPLPPYIKRIPQESDNIYYQTVYAKNDGAVAAPTAGLHFTKDLLLKLAGRNVSLGYITLHVGYATFRPVKQDDITKHQMEPEYFKVPDKTAALIESARARGARICAVGTTSLRTLEAYALTGLKEGNTGLFIYPGFEFKITDCLLTNFHLPRTTLFMLVCAFAGKNFIKKAYQEAVDKKYRFYSYGDAMLIV